MKNIKFYKLISLLLTFVLVCPLFTVGAAEQDEQPIDTYAYQLLKGLGATNSELDALSENATMTRAQYVYILAKLMGYNDEVNTAADPFIDVKDGVYSGAIYYLRSLGIVNGVNAHQFKPDEAVSLESAYIMSLRAMDYDELISVKYGDNKNAVILMAADADIDEGVSAVDVNAITLGEGAEILANTATKPVLYQVSFGDETEYNSKSYSILSVYSDIVYAEGIMTNSGITSIGESPSSNGRVTIGGRELTNKSFNDAYKLIGKNVEFFYTKDKNELIYAQEFNNNVIEIDADDIIPGSTTINSVAYYNESGKQKSADLMVNTKMIYNGFAHPYFTADDIKISDGKITLVDNDNDGDYEVVIVDEYTDFITASISDTTFVTTDKAFELDTYNYVYLYDANGNAITYDSVAVGAVATVYQSKENQVFSAYFSMQSVSGVLESVGEDQNGVKTYRIGEQSFELSASLQNKILAGDIADFDIGTGYICKLNIFGEIADTEKIEGDEWKVAYCVGIAKPNGSSIDSRVQANLVMTDNSNFMPCLKTKINLNGSSVKATDLLNSTYFFDNDGTPLRQPVKIKINNNGEITAIEVPEDRVSTTYGIDTTVFSYDCYITDATYRGGNNQKTIKNCVLKSDTIIFEDPYYNVEGAVGKTEDIRSYSMEVFTNEARLYDARFYDLDKAYRPDIMVFREKENTVDGSPFLVENVISVLDEEGNRIKRVSGYRKNAYYIYDEYEAGIVPDSLKRGDVCRLAIDGTKIVNISAPSEIMSLKERNPYADIDVINARNAIVYGYLYSATDTSMVVVSPESYTDTPLIGSSIGGANVIVYELGADKMYIGSVSDIYTDFVPDSQGNYTLSDDSTFVYMRRNYDRAEDIIVVRK